MTLDVQKVKQKIGKAIARRRLESGLTQDQVAEHLSIGNEAVSRIERGLVEPSVVRLFEFAELFKCTAADLLREGSLRREDQVEEVTKLLNALSSDDREAIISMIQIFVSSRNA